MISQVLRRAKAGAVWPCLSVSLHPFLLMTPPLGYASSVFSGPFSALNSLDSYISFCVCLIPFCLPYYSVKSGEG